MDYIKKAIIKMSLSWKFPQDANVYKLSNGYVFNNKFYKEIDDMRDDIVRSLKEYFE